MLKFLGHVQTGFRCVSLVDGGVVSEFALTEKDKLRIFDSGAKVLVSSNASLVVCDGVIIGTRGANKFFARVDDSSGVLVFASLNNGKPCSINIAKSEVKTANILHKNGMHNGGDLVEIFVDFVVNPIVTGKRT